MLLPWVPQHGHRIYIYQIAKTTLSKKAESHQASLRRFLKLKPPEACFPTYLSSFCRSSIRKVKREKHSCQ